MGVSSNHQLRLLPAPQPLVERLGAEFFRSIPSSPGIYRFLSASGSVLYVGKASNLKSRLSSYRRSSGQSSKTIRLLHEADRIEWEILPSDSAARLRENHLIRTLRPRFNRIGVWPQAAWYVCLKSVSHGRPALSLTRDRSQATHGAFRPWVRHALAAWRLLGFWMAQDRVSVFDVPHPVRWFPPTEDWVLDAWWDEKAIGLLDDYLRGESDEWIRNVLSTLPPSVSRFDAEYAGSLLLTAVEFYQRSCVGNRLLRGKRSESSSLLSPEDLDDLPFQDPPWVSGERIANPKSLDPSATLSESK